MVLTGKPYYTVGLPLGKSSVTGFTTILIINE